MAPSCGRRAGRRCSTRTPSGRVRPLPRRSPRAPGGRHGASAGRALVHELPQPAGRRSRVFDVSWIGIAGRPTARSMLLPGRRRRGARSARRAFGDPLGGPVLLDVSPDAGSLRHRRPARQRDRGRRVRPDRGGGERRATIHPPARAPCRATTRGAPSRGSRGSPRQRRSGAATATVRPPRATTPVPAPSATRRPTPPARPSPADRFT